MASFLGTCEIVEVKDELHSIQCSRETYGLKSRLNLGDSDHKLPVLKMKCKESIEDDINRLFEAITLKTSLKGLGFSLQEGTSPLRKNALKKPITMSMPHSPRVGHSEPVSLKQALREQSICKASEMAATKHLSKSSVPSGNSEAGRIKSLYRTVVVEANHASTSIDECKGHVHHLHQKPPHHLHVSDKKSSNESVQSFPQCVTTLKNGKETTPLAEDVDSGPIHLKALKIKTSNLSAPSSSFLQNVVATTDGIVWTAPKQIEIVSTSKKVAIQTLKMELEQEERYSPPSTPSCSNTSGQKLKLNEKVSVSTKTTNKASAPKLERKGMLQTPLPSSSSRNTPRLAKPVLRNKRFVKKKKQEATSADCNNEVNSDLNPSTSELVCQRCKCNMKDVSKESDQYTSASHHAQVSSSKVNSNSSKAGFISSSCNDGSTVTPKVKSSKSMENFPTARKAVLVKVAAVQAPAVRAI